MIYNLLRKHRMQFFFFLRSEEFLHDENGEVVTSPIIFFIFEYQTDILGEHSHPNQ